jgi:murein DD-endopeptidase MepM/ murein hydrolase activator NlpD
VRSRTVISMLTVLLCAVMVLPASALTELEGARERAEALETRILDAAGSLEGLEEQIAESEAAIAALDDEDQRLLAELGEANASLIARTRTAFMRGDRTSIESLISGDSPGDIAERAVMLESLAIRDRAAMESAAATRIGLDQNRMLREGRLSVLDDLRSELDAALGQLNDDLEEARGDERFFELKARRQRELNTAFANGVYSCPVGDPVFFRDTWGARRSGGRSHQGVDMMAPHGTPIYAIHAGRVTRMKTGGLGGIVLYMYGADGNEYYYAHLQGYANGISPGSYVDAGDLIGYNGATGNARGGSPHVHFEVHPGGGRPVNPYPWTAAACGR